MSDGLSPEAWVGLGTGIGTAVATGVLVAQRLLKKHREKPEAAANGDRIDALSKLIEAQSDKLSRQDEEISELRATIEGYETELEECQKLRARVTVELDLARESINELKQQNVDLAAELAGQAKTLRKAMEELMRRDAGWGRTGTRISPRRDNGDDET
jgi:septal ring factor EnvC (AmiA/AmiB activator)